MELVSDLRQKHLSGWTKAIRALKPPEVDNIVNLPDAEFHEVGIKAAIKAGWVVGVTDAAIVDEMKYPEVVKLSAAVWEAFNKARQIDPN